MTDKEIGEPSSRCGRLTTEPTRPCMRKPMSPYDIYRVFWPKTKDELFIQVVFDVSHMVPMDTPSHLESAIDRIHFVLTNQSETAGVTRLMVREQYSVIYRRFRNFMRFISRPGVEFNPTTHVVTTTKAYYNRVTKDSVVAKYFRKFGLPQYDELFYIFAVKDAHILPEDVVNDDAPI